MKSRLEMTDDGMGSSVTATFMSAVRHAVLASAIAVPLAILATAEGFEGDSECASAGELWLDVQNRMKVATERQA
jgi:hypothetical protein